MSVKKTKLLVAEIRVIADTVISEYCRNILNEAADRLEETDRYAEFLRGEHERLVEFMESENVKKIP